MRNLNNDGSMRKNNVRGRYEFRITYKDPVTNESRRKMFTSTKTAKEAKQKAYNFLEQLKQTALNKERFSLGDWLVKWLKVYKENTLKPKTLERYWGYVKNYIAPFDIGTVDITKLSTVLLQEHFNMLLNKGGMNNNGIAPRTVNSVRRLIMSALDEAVEEELITKNPASRTRPMAVSKSEMMVLTHEEGQKLIKSALKHDRISWIIIQIALGTGMRIGEIFGLEWKNVDINRRTIKVEKTVVTTRHGILVQNGGKTRASQRTIPIPESICRSLERYRLWQKVRTIRFGYNYLSSPWVLSNPDGVNPRSPNSFSAHAFKDILVDAGISNKFRIHDMRHTHATWLLAADVNVKVVSERLGHSNIRITLDTYAHVLGTMQEKAVEALSNII